MYNQQSPSADQFWNLLAKKLLSEATNKDLEDLHVFLINNPELQYQADLITEMWKQSEQEDREEGEAAYVRHLLKYKNDFFQETTPINITNELGQEEDETKNNYAKIFSGRKGIVLFLATIILTVSVIGTYLFINKTNELSQEPQTLSSIVTKNGNRTKIVLPDGTQVWLNAGSKFDYDNLVFNKTAREVILDGEAYFDVTKNPDKPFIIHTRKMDIKVLGTAFNVRSYNYEKFAEASLIRGSIEVTLKDRKDQKLILKPNEKISIPAQEIPDEPERLVKQNSETSVIPQIVVKPLQPNPKINIISEIAWTQNKLVIEDEDLETISLMLERWFGKKVIIINESLKKARYTYTDVRNETLEEILSYLKLSRPFNFKTEKDAIIIY